MADAQQLLVKQQLDTLLSSLAILESLSVVAPADAALIRATLPSPNAQGRVESGPTAVHSPGGSLIDHGPGGTGSPYPAPIYGQQQQQQQGGGAYRPPPALPTRAPAGLGEARAAWDYEASAADDLPFKKDDLIVITEESNADWWKGFVVGHPGRIGLFPSSYVNRLPSNAPPRPYASSPAPSFHPSDYAAEKHQQAFHSPGYPTAHSPAPPQGFQPNQSYGHPQQQQQQGPMVPYQQPYQPPPLHMVQHDQQQQQAVVQAPPPPQKSSKFDGMGKLLASSAVGGVGFGAGSAVGSGIINSIFR